jgi:signal transduction histidine kinase
VDAVPEEGRVTVESSADSKKGGPIRIIISDTGSGIDPEDLKKIFNPFFTTKEVGKGTGLGLSISYGIVKDHGGQLEASSVLGEGTTFTITLPAEKMSEIEDESTKNQSALR